MEDTLTYILFFGVLIACAFIYLDNSEFDLKCIVSSVDGNKYCVRERKRLVEAADLLAKVTTKCNELVDYMRQHHGDKENVQRLLKGFDKTVIKETLPTNIHQPKDYSDSPQEYCGMTITDSPYYDQ